MRRATEKPRRPRPLNDLAAKTADLREELVARHRGRTFVDAKSLSLEEWLTRLDDMEVDDEFMMLSTCFPSSEHRKEYLDTIHTRGEPSIHRLLRRFLPCTGTHPVDLDHLQWIMSELGKRDSARHVGEYDVRLMRHWMSDGDQPVWEGIHWVLDAIGQAPSDALHVLRTFLRTYWQQLPDAYINGIEDAAEVIRWRYLISPHTRDRCKGVIASLSPRDLELLAAVLYDAMGYDYEVTRASKDGGVDVIAYSKSKGKRQRYLIQCKHTASVGVDPVNQILAIVERRRATQAVVLTSGRFTRGALAIQAEEDRVELVDGDNLIERLNEHVGPEWYTRVEHILAGIASRIDEANRNATASDTPKKATKKSRSRRPTRARSRPGS